MLHDLGVIAAAFGYIGFLFFVASYGDRTSRAQRGRAGALIYPLWRSGAQGASGPQNSPDVM